MFFILNSEDSVDWISSNSYFKFGSIVIFLSFLENLKINLLIEFSMFVFVHVELDFNRLVFKEYAFFQAKRYYDSKMFMVFKKKPHVLAADVRDCELYRFLVVEFSNSQCLWVVDQLFWLLYQETRAFAIDNMRPFVRVRHLHLSYLLFLNMAVLSFDVPYLESFTHSRSKPKHPMRHELEVIRIRNADVIRGTFEG